MAEKFNLSGLQKHYHEMYHSPDKSLAVDIPCNEGVFLFMMFLSDEDKDTKDMLYIYMRKTKVLKKYKTYGSHKNGDFYVYLSHNDQMLMKNELNLHGGDTPFDFNRFFNELNLKLAQKEVASHSKKIEILREHKDIISGVIDEREKTELIGIKHLTKGTPQDRTLRKLYLLRSDTPNEITNFIKHLKKANCTVAWTTPENANRVVTLNELLQKML